MWGINQADEATSGKRVDASLDKQASDPSARSEEITISCYENEVPSFVAAEMDQLYAHINSSLSHFRVRRNASEASTYVARRGSRAIAILLFRREKDKVIVFNEMIAIGDEEIRRFAQYIFTACQSVSIISFSLIRDERHRLPFPCQKFNSSEDIVLTLPATPQAYKASLGSQTRKNIKRHMKALTRDFPAYRFQIYDKEEISEQQVRDIISLSKARIRGKNITFGIGEEEAEWIVQLVKACGLVGVITINERVCAGAINFRIGENYFGHVIAHDPGYNDYGLGIVCYYLTICESILRGGKEFHFSWGRYEYKYRLLGVQRDMTSLDVYRSYTSYFRHAPAVMKNGARSFLHRKKMQILDLERKNTTAARLATRLIKYLRRLKRMQAAH